VRRHQVEEHPQPERVRLADERVEIVERPQPRVDARVVGDVVAEVRERRGVDRREPERGHAEVGEVVEPPRDPGQVADAVAVRVLERARVDLVDDRVPPPHRAPRIDAARR
jgi:hypothetical protein